MKDLPKDETTVTEQILPYLSTHTTPKALRMYLQDLIGTSSEAKALADQVVAQRFPTHAEPTRKRDTKPIRLTPGTVVAALAESEERAMPRTLEPTPEMKALDLAFAMVSTEPSSSAAQAYAPTIRCICLCQGRRHPLAAWVPQCTSCGLLLCEALRPVVVSPFSVCPSCQKSPIVTSSARARLLSSMVERRERLAREQWDHEAKRHAEWQLQRTSGRVPDQPFPTLHGTPTPTPSKPPTQRNRVLRLDTKTHKVTIAPSKPAAKAGKKGATAPGGASKDTEEEWRTTAEDGSMLVHDYDDDQFRERYAPEASISSASPTKASWAGLSSQLLWTPTYVPATQRDAAMAPLVSDILTEVPDMDLLLQRKPPGSTSTDTRRQNRSKASASAIARSQGRKSGKAGKKR